MLPDLKVSLKSKNPVGWNKTVSEYIATIIWNRGNQLFGDGKYSRGHLWEFDGGISVPASASPQVVPSPLSVAANVDPEEAFVAALSSCHMLFFLSVAAKQGYIIDSYTDQAVGTMESDESGKISMIRVVLRPEVIFSGSTPCLIILETMHHEAHELCFIANSVKSEIIIEAVRQ